MTHSDQDNSYILDALPVFISEAQEQLEAIEHLLLELEDNPGDRDLLNAMFRCAHTVKGSAGIFGLDNVVAFTHHVETLLDLIREGQVELTPELSTLFLRCNDQIRVLISSALDPSADDPDAQMVRAELVRQMQSYVDHSAGASVGEQDTDTTSTATDTLQGLWQVSVRFHADTFRNGMDPLAILNYVAALGTVTHLVCDTAAVPPLEGIDAESCHLAFEFSLDTEATREEIEAAFSFVRDDCTLLLTEPAAASADQAAMDALPLPPAEAHEQADSSVAPKTSRPREGKTGVSAADDNRFIRVQADKLDAVINLLGELVIASAGAGLLARQTRQTNLIEANQQISSLVEEIRNGTLQLRMVPIGETFSRFRRVVRDTAAELGKDVSLDIVGGDTELDKSVVERIADPLMHLVRNALDHGLETPEQRIAAGKPAQGTLTISACHEAGSILIGIEDDGRGIDRDRVLRRAWERGLLEQGVVPADDDILNLIFEAGFSTAEKVTNLSGRGVGMDVVRRNIEALRGSVTLSSEPGLGSHIALRLPLTLAIIDGFLIAVGPSKFIFPLDAVVEVIESGPAVSSVDERGRSVAELRGEVLPVVSLRALYALDSEEPERSSVVVIRAGNLRYGVKVDQLLGQHQTVIKPLGRMFRSLRGMSGSSILGNGEVALIFDVSSLAQLAAVETGRRSARSDPINPRNTLKESQG